MKKIYFFIVAALIMFASCTENYSQGERIGTVVQFSKTGLVFESWEGQLNLTQTGMNTSGEPFNFSFDNDRADQDSLIKLVEEAQREGWKIKIKYHETIGKNWFHNRGNTNHFVTDVIVVDRDFAHPLKINSAETVKNEDGEVTFQLGTKENPIHVVVDNK